MDNKDYYKIENILVYIDKVLDYSQNSTYDDFQDSNMITDSCIFNIGLIGEEIGKLSEEFKSEHPEIPFNAITNTRNRIFHDYDGINYTIVWQIIKEDLPDLRTQFEEIKTKMMILICSNCLSYTMQRLCMKMEA